MYTRCCSTLRSALLFSFVFSLSPARAQQQCHFHDGTVAANYSPCNSTAPVTHCCQDGQACLSNGLCFVSYSTSIYTGTCTDATWQDDSCFLKCTQTIGNKNDISTLYRCNNDNWCCSTGGNVTSCCQDDEPQFNLKSGDLIQNGSDFAPGMTLVPTARLQQFPTTSSNSSSSSNTTNSSSAATSNPDCPSQPSISASIAAAASTASALKVGLGVGLGIGIPLLLALGGASFLYWREKRTNQDLKKNLGYELPNSAYKEAHPINTPRGELSAYQPTPELPNDAVKRSPGSF